MASQSVLQSRLDEIERKLRLGVESVTSDGTTTRVNLEALQEERRQLRRQITASKAKRPTYARIVLG